jgi:thermitase
MIKQTRGWRLWKALLASLLAIGPWCAAHAFTEGDGVPPDAPGLYVADELLVQSKAGVHRWRMDEIFRGHGAWTKEHIPHIRVDRIHVPPQALKRVQAALARDPHINYVERNPIARAMVVPNDPQYASEWHLGKISAPQGWAVETGSPDVPIAILDTGVDPDHPDLSAKLLPGYNFYSRNGDTTDVHGHGTAVAGSAAAISNNDVGVAGVAWENPILPVRIADPQGTATHATMALAIAYAVDQGAKVINLSFGGTGNSTTLQNAINDAWNRGAIVVAAAANSNTSTPYYPAACANVIAVSATTSSDTRASFSNFGNWVDVSAPGVNILSTSNGGGYGYWSGTSFSSPITAGLAALIFSANPALTNAQVVDILTLNGDDLGTPDFDPYFGHGRINVYKSLLAAGNAVPHSDLTAPTVSIQSPAPGASVGGAITVGVTASDDAGVSRVELYVDSSLLATDTTQPYSFFWDSSQYQNGVHTLVARAYDPSGNEGISAPVTVTVTNAGGDTIPPTVTILSPRNGARVAASTRIQVRASDIGGISRTELYVDGTRRATSNSGTLTWLWNTTRIATGSHTISATSYDAAGNQGTASVTVHK